MLLLGLSEMSEASFRIGPYLLPALAGPVDFRVDGGKVAAHGERRSARVRHPGPQVAAWADPLLPGLPSSGGGHHRRDRLEETRTGWFGVAHSRPGCRPEQDSSSRFEGYGFLVFGLWFWAGFLVASGFDGFPFIAPVPPHQSPTTNH